RFRLEGDVMDQGRRLRGACLCGRVGISVYGAPLNVRACHCRLCQKAAGGPFYVRAIYPKSQVDLAGELRLVNSSPRLMRVFCPACGSLVASDPLDRPEYYGVNVALLDDQAALRPEMHIWTSSKAPWLELADGLPQHAEGVPW